jgi:hypothetical protein
MNAAYDAGYSGFVAVLDAQAAAARLDLFTLSTDIGIPTPEHSAAIARLFAQLRARAEDGADLDLADFQSWIYNEFSSFLSGMSLILENTSGRYTFSDGSLPYSGTGTEDGASGSGTADGISSAVSVYDLVHPLVTNRWVRVIIRATRVSDGLQECYDEVLEIELDENGDVIPARPNAAYISSIAANNLSLVFNVQSRTDDQRVGAARLAIYVSAAPNSPNYASPTASAVVGSEITGLVSANVSYTFPVAGYYIVAAKALTTAGVQSEFAKESTIWVGTEQPAGPTGIRAEVIRATPDRAEEDE